MAKGYQKKVRTELVAVVGKDGAISTVQNPVYIPILGDANYSQWLFNLSPIIKSFKNVSDFKLLYWIGRNIPYNEGIICLNKIYKKRCAKDMGFAVSSIDKSLHRLKEKEILIAHEDSKKSAVFRVNPAYLWVGDKSNREKQERKWLLDKQINDLPERERDQQKLIKKSREHKYDFSKIKAAR